MKKISLLIALVAFVCGNAFAQFSYDFNDCTAGAKIAQTLGDPWTTWGNNPGTDKDGVVAFAQASQCAKYSHLIYGVDPMLLPNGQEPVTFDLKSGICVPNGKNDYSHIPYEFNSSKNFILDQAEQPELHHTSGRSPEKALPCWEIYICCSSNDCHLCLCCSYDDIAVFKSIFCNSSLSD